MPTIIATIESLSTITPAADPVTVTDGYLQVVNATGKKVHFLVSYTTYEGTLVYELGYFLAEPFSFGVDDTVAQVDMWVSGTSFLSPSTNGLPTTSPASVSLDNQSSLVTIASDTEMRGPDGTHNVTNSSGRIMVSVPEGTTYYAYFDGNTDTGVPLGQQGELQVAPNGEPAYTQVRFSQTASSPDLTNAPVFVIRHTSHATVVLGFTDGVQHAFPAIVSPDSGSMVCVVNTATAEQASMSVAGAVNGSWSWTNFPAKLAPRGGTYIVDTSQVAGNQCLINWDLTGDPRVVVMKPKLVGGGGS